MNFFVDTGRDRDITWPYKEDPALVYDENRLTTGIKLANRRVYELAQSDARYRGMGTTMVTLSSSAGGTFVGHVGDSRCYVIKDSQIAQVTEDHSLLNDYLKVHQLTPEEIANFPHKNVIVRALGMKDAVAVDIKRLEPKGGETFVLCSDGLSGMVNDPTILQTVLDARGDLEKLCQDLIAKANANGGADNVTAVVVAFD